jgi:RimJ/RimL family protein N-acetyltransferase
MNYSYRLATLADLPTLRALWRDFIVETDVPYPTNMLGSLDTFTRQIAIALAQAPARVFAFLAEEPGHGVPVGMLIYEIQGRMMGEPERFGFIHCAFVDPGHRRQGLTAELAALAAEHMLAQGLQQAEITTVPANAGWSAFAGFVPYETRSHVPIALGLARLDKRRARLAAERGNGLDVAAPLTAEQPETGAKEEE